MGCPCGRGVWGSLQSRSGLCPGAPRSLSLAGDWRVKNDTISPEARRPRVPDRAPAPPGETDFGEAAPRPHPVLLEVAGGGGITCYRACSQAEQTGPRPMPLPVPVRAPTTDRCWVQGGEAWGWGALSRGVTVRRGQSRPPGPASSPERPAAPVGAGLNAEPSARAGVRWRSHARLRRPGKSGRSQGRPAPRPRRLALNGF